MTEINKEVSRFTNKTVYTADLPSVQMLVFEPLHASYSKVVWTQVLLVGLILTMTGVFPYAYGAFVMEEYQFEWPGLGWVVLIVLYVLFGIVKVLGVAKKGYVLREHDLVYQTGTINRKTIVVPYNRVQHVALFEGILLRLFGLCKLEFYTAGGTMGDLKIPGLSKETAEKIKLFVSEKIKQDSLELSTGSIQSFTETATDDKL